MRTSLIKIRDQVNQMLDSMTVSETKEEVEGLLYKIKLLGL